MSTRDLESSEGKSEKKKTPPEGGQYALLQEKTANADIAAFMGGPLAHAQTMVDQHFGPVTVEDSKVGLGEYAEASVTIPDPGGELATIKPNDGSARFKDARVIDDHIK
jgi:hypothetical protein